MSEIHGEVTRGFERVKDAFANNFEQHADLGAAFSVYYRGAKVVDLWGGLADAETMRPWARDSLQLVFSSTKGAAALCANLLIQRGELDVDAPVAKYWPEFAGAGKQDIPVRYLLSHQVGLPHIPKMTLAESYTWDAPIKRLEAQNPAWEPGTKHGYHPGTFGWLVGELIRRITGKTPGTFMADEVAGPLGLDFWIGLPEAEEHRVTTVQSVDPSAAQDTASMTQAQRNMIAAAQIPDSLLSLSMSVSPPETDPNSRAFHAHEQPAASGITDARSLARMYASLIGDGVDGIRLLNDETVRLASTEQAGGIDAVMAVPTRFGLGFSLNSPIAPGFPEYASLAGALGNEGAFGHQGAGGSLGFADPKAGFSFAYVMNQMHMVTGGDDPRTLSLIKAVHQALS